MSLRRKFNDNLVIMKADANIRHKLLVDPTMLVTEGVSPSFKCIYGDVIVPAAVTGQTQYIKAGQFRTTVATGAAPAEVWGVYGIVDVAGTGNPINSWPVVGELTVAGTGNYGNAQANSFHGAGFFHSAINATKTFLGGIDAPLFGVIELTTGRRKADVAIAAILNGAINQSTAGAGAAFKAYDFSATDPGFDYGLDLYYSSGSYANVFAVADFRLSANTHIISGTATTRQAVETAFPAAPIGSVYISSGAGGVVYVKKTDAGANTDWQRVTTSAAD